MCNERRRPDVSHSLSAPCEKGENRTVAAIKQLESGYKKTQKRKLQYKIRSMGKIGWIVQSQTCYHKVVLIKSDNYYFLIFYIEIDYLDYYSCNSHLILSFRLGSEFFNKGITTIRIVQSKTIVTRTPFC